MSSALLASRPSFLQSVASYDARTTPTINTHSRATPMLSSFKTRFSRKGAVSPTGQPASAGKPLGQNTPTSPVYRQQQTRRPNRAGMNAFTTPSNEPPPAYTPNPTGGNAAPSSSSDAAGDDGDDHVYSFLSTFDTIFLIDDSGSMAGRSWRETSQALETIAPICTRFDADGIDIHFLNTAHQPFHSNVTLASTVHEIFSTVRPSGGTPTGMRLNNILKPYLRDLERNPETTKPINVIVITDGVPSDDVESVLINAAKKLDRLDAEPWQVGVQFFQVGEEDGAAEHLAGLDDELSRMGDGCRDIVDTVPFVRAGPSGRGNGLTADAILKVVLGAVNRRLDRRRNSDVTASAAAAAAAASAAISSER